MIQYYSLSVGLYARFAGSDTPLQEITLNSLRAYYLHLAERNISSTTIQTYIRSFLFQSPVSGASPQLLYVFSHA